MLYMLVIISQFIQDQKLFGRMRRHRCIRIYMCYQRVTWVNVGTESLLTVFHFMVAALIIFITAQHFIPKMISLGEIKLFFQ